MCALTVEWGEGFLWWVSIWGGEEGGRWGERGGGEGEGERGG